LKNIQIIYSFIPIAVIRFDEWNQKKKTGNEKEHAPKDRWYITIYNS